MTRQRSRSPLGNYRSTDPNAGAWWERAADPVGLHSFLAFVLGLALVAIVGVALDPLGVTTEFDLPRVEQAAFDEAYTAAREAGRSAGIEQAKRETLVALALDSPDGTSQWVQGVVAGWSEGWNQALEALEAASGEHAPVDEQQRELDLLAEIARR